MGGFIGLTIREANGKEHRLSVTTGFIPQLIKNLKFIQLDTKYLKDFLSEVSYALTESFSPNRPQILAPDQYGLIVIDYKTKSIVQSQDYTGINTIGESEMKFCLKSKPTEFSEYRELFAANKIVGYRGFDSKKGFRTIKKVLSFDELNNNFESYFLNPDMQIQEFLINMGPWRVDNYKPYNSAYGQKMKIHLLNLGFQLNNAEEKAWTEFYELHKH